jgi:cytochrome bd ubiquinol oxidase subunit II
MDLETFWFCLIGVLWAGYFVLEGFDFGVGMLLPFLGRNEDDRRTMMTSIGPHWDGNEVWLVVAAGGTFAAFPAWYATLFSAYYLGLLLVLVLLILRVVSFEWGERVEDPRWRTMWRRANTTASVGVPFVWGVALSGLVYGIPLNTDGDFSGSLTDLISPYTLLAGVAAVLVFALHGAMFLALRTAGDLHVRARALARRICVPVALVAAAFLAATVAVGMERNERDVLPAALPAAAGVLALALAVVFLRAGRGGRAFAATALTAALLVATIFTALYPRVLVSQPAFANSLTIDGAATGHYALSVITVVAAILTPLVLVYQGWTYHVFRARLGGPPPAEEEEKKDEPVADVERRVLGSRAG